MSAELRAAQLRDLQRRSLTNSGIFSYVVRYKNGHEQSLTSKIAPVTEGEIIPDENQSLHELPPIHGYVAYIHGQHAALQRERVQDEARAQATLSGAFHAVHKLVIGTAEPKGGPVNERRVPFTAIPLFIHR